MLTAEQMEFWKGNGFLILREVFGPERLVLIRREVEKQWSGRGSFDYDVDVLTGPYSGQTMKSSQLPPECLSEVIKLNNLFIGEQNIRSIALDPFLKDAIDDLLEGEPVICNSLNFERGSQQPYHLDTWYMPPPVDDKMVAVSIAVEDMDTENGALTFYPGSHLIPGWRFSNGRLNMIEAEAPLCQAYLDNQIRERSLDPVDLICKAGDVFIWHAQLLHGGRPIRDMSRTRRSLVVHYWRKEDVPVAQVRSDSYGAFLAKTLRGELSLHDSRK